MCKNCEDKAHQLQVNIAAAMIQEDAYYSPRKLHFSGSEVTDETGKTHHGVTVAFTFDNDDKAKEFYDFMHKFTDGDIPDWEEHKRQMEILNQAQMSDTGRAAQA